MRLFLAVELPEEVKNDLYEQLEPLRKKFPDVRWVDPKMYHITLFFFGDNYSEDHLKTHIENVTYDTEAFRMYSGENGLFMKNALTLWVGFIKCQPIERAVKRIKTELRINDNLKFFPHLTVARHRIGSKQQYLLLKKRFLQETVDIEFAVSQITLFESVIEKNVPIYIPKCTFPLLQYTD